MLSLSSQPYTISANVGGRLDLLSGYKGICILQMMVAFCDFLLLQYISIHSTSVGDDRSDKFNYVDGPHPSGSLDTPSDPSVSVHF